MACRAFCVAFLLSSLPIVGFGTVVNLVKPGPEEGGVIPFGGVKHDVKCIHTGTNGETHPKSEQQLQVARMLFCAADLPFSLLGDVVTWPYTVAYSYINQPIPVPPVTVTNPPATQASPTPPLTPPMPTPIPPVTQATPVSQPKTVP